MDLAAVDATRVVEGVLGGLLVVVALAFAGAQVFRWRRIRRLDHEDPGPHALARFVDVTLNDPTAFGGGAQSGRIRSRRDTVTYGYLAVAEEYEGGRGLRWCTLTVMLPGRVPFLVADNRAAVGRPGVPLDAPHHAVLDDAAFDAGYLVGAEERWVISRVLTPTVRDVLLGSPLQRLMLRETSLLLRTFDGAELDDGMIAWLSGVGEKILCSTPSFFTSIRAGAGDALPADAGARPLQPGFYGPDGDPD